MLKKTLTMYKTVAFTFKKIKGLLPVIYIIIYMFDAINNIKLGSLISKATQFNTNYHQVKLESVCVTVLTTHTLYTKERSSPHLGPQQASVTQHSTD